MITAQQITEVINRTYEGVDKAKFGNLLTKERDPNGYPVYNQMAWNVFLNTYVHTLGQVIKSQEPKNENK